MFPDDPTENGYGDGEAGEARDSEAGCGKREEAFLSFMLLACLFIFMARRWIGWKQESRLSASLLVTGHRCESGFRE